MTLGPGMVIREWVPLLAFPAVWSFTRLAGESPDEPNDLSCRGVDWLAGAGLSKAKEARSDVFAFGIHLVPQILS